MILTVFEQQLLKSIKTHITICSVLSKNRVSEFLLYVYILCNYELTFRLCFLFMHLYVQSFIIYTQERCTLVTKLYDFFVKFLTENYRIEFGSILKQYAIFMFRL